MSLKSADKLSHLFAPARSLSQEHQDIFAQLLVRREYQEGDLLFIAGSVSDVMHFIVRGTVEVFFETSAREVVPLARLGPGETLGEMGVIDDRSRTASARALVDVHTLTLCQQCYRDLAARGDPLAVWLLDVTANTLARRILAMEERVARAKADPSILKNLPLDPRANARRWWEWIGFGRTS